MVTHLRSGLTLCHHKQTSLSLVVAGTSSLTFALLVEGRVAATHAAIVVVADASLVDAAFWNTEAEGLSWDPDVQTSHRILTSTLLLLRVVTTWKVGCAVPNANNLLLGSLASAFPTLAYCHVLFLLCAFPYCVPKRNNMTAERNSKLLFNPLKPTQQITQTTSAISPVSGSSPPHISGEHVLCWGIKVRNVERKQGRLFKTRNIKTLWL